MGANSDESHIWPGKIVSPVTFLTFVNLILTGDIVMSITGGQANIGTWSSLLQWATPVHVLATIMLMGVSYLLVEPLLTVLTYKIIYNFQWLCWLFGINEQMEIESRKAKSASFIHKSTLKRWAMKENHAIALKLWQESNRNEASRRHTASHLTVFFILVLLDGLYGGPFISLVDNLSGRWAVFWVVYALLLVFYAYAALQNESDYVYIGDLGPDMFNPLNSEPTEPLKHINEPKVSS